MARNLDIAHTSHKGPGVCSIVEQNWYRKWYLNGVPHRENGPAVEPLRRYDGAYWYRHGRLHRENGPAIVGGDGSRAWFVDGKRHRQDGPAVIAPGYEEWYINDELHRDDGPAVVCTDGNMQWCRNGVYHREDGPAVIYSSGREEYWLSGKRVEKEAVMGWFRKRDFLALMIKARGRYETKSCCPEVEQLASVLWDKRLVQHCKLRYTSRLGGNVARLL